VNRGVIQSRRESDSEALDEDLPRTQVQGVVKFIEDTQSNLSAIYAVRGIEVSGEKVRSRSPNPCQLSLGLGVL